jgi:hypothetical protein
MSSKELEEILKERELQDINEREKEKKMTNSESFSTSITDENLDLESTKTLYKNTQISDSFIQRKKKKIEERRFGQINPYLKAMFKNLNVDTDKKNTGLFNETLYPEACSYVSQEELKVVNLVRNKKVTDPNKMLHFPFKNSKSYNQENRNRMERKFSNMIILNAFTLLILILSRVGMILFHPEHLKNLSELLHIRNKISLTYLNVCIETTHYLSNGFAKLISAILLGKKKIN